MIMFSNEMQTIQDFQAFHRWLDEKNHFDPDLLFNMVLLSSEVGEVAQVLKKIRKQAHLLKHEQEPAEAMSTALSQYREDLGQELADCLAYIFKLANYAGIDLQEAYLNKMAENIDRTWKTPNG
jgi:NTP pyrophosphatase (non-canonical NTP hydrolase)